MPIACLVDRIPPFSLELQLSGSVPLRPPVSSKASLRGTTIRYFPPSFIQASPRAIPSSPSLRRAFPSFLITGSTSIRTEHLNRRQAGALSPLFCSRDSSSSNPSKGGAVDISHTRQALHPQPLSIDPIAPPSVDSRNNRFFLTLFLRTSSHLCSTAFRPIPYTLVPSRFATHHKRPTRKSDEKYPYRIPFSADTSLVQDIHSPSRALRYLILIQCLDKTLRQRLDLVNGLSW